MDFHVHVHMGTSHAVALLMPLITISFELEFYPACLSCLINVFISHIYIELTCTIFLGSKFFLGDSINLIKLRNRGNLLFFFLNPRHL